jgi:hypothetical protein
MSHHVRVRRPVPSGKAPSESSGGKRKWIITAVVLLLLAAAAWAFIPNEDPALARIQEIRAQIDTAPPEQRRELFGQMRQEFENLAPESREQLRDEWRKRWEAREQKQMNDFFALSPAEQVKEIDEDIREDIERDKQRAQRRAQRQASGQGNAGGGGRGDRRASRSGFDMAQRRKNYLDNTTPQARAQRSEYRRMRDERRQAMGLPARGR